MKKIAIVGLVTLCSTGAYAQGQVAFMPYQTQYFVDAQVYSPNPGNPSVQVQGDTATQISNAGLNSSAGINAGFPTLTPVTYAGTPIGGSSWTGTTPVSFSGAGASVYSYGNLFTAELYALSTTTVQAIPPGTTLASLSPVTQYQTTFATSSSPFGAGYFSEATPANDSGIPGTGYIGGTPRANRQGTTWLGNNAAAAVVAWYSGGGQFATYAAAQAAGAPTGYSAIFEINNLVEPQSVMVQDENNNSSATAQQGLQGGTQYLNGYDNNAFGGDGAMTTLQSFNLTMTPEPSTIALGVLGACAFLARRRKK
jgi:hypothetical protein